MPKEIIIAGAGLSGLVAGINLARAGHPVKIFEKNETVGGNAAYIDSTYISPEDIKAFSGVDITPSLDPWKETTIYAYGKKFIIKNPDKIGAYTVERGSGENAVDTLLYEQALEAGVSIELGNGIDPKNIGNLPPDAIIATGLSGEIFRALNIPSRPFYCYLGSKRIKSRQSKIIVYFDDFAREYGYYFQARGISGALVFNVHRPLTDGEKSIFRQKLEKNDGITFDNWNDSISDWAVWPVGGWRNLKLFHGDKIVTGTLAGAVNPVILFGVHGALVTGKIAAIAVNDRKRAQKEFRKINSNYFIHTALRRYKEHAPQFLLKPLFRMVLAIYHPKYFYQIFMHAIEPPGLKYIKKQK